MTASTREAIPQTANPLGLAGIEFVEYATSRPQALGRVLELMGFRPVAQHRSREVLLYRQGDMNIVVNAHGTAGPNNLKPGETPVISAVALRVRDAAAAHRRVVELGGWPVTTHVEPMELNIPAIHGVGASRIYFVDRHEEFSIYDVDFVPIATVDQRPPAVAGLHWFGLVQYIGLERIEDWTAFYTTLLGFDAVPDEERFGILPSGRILRSPGNNFYIQLIEPPIDIEYGDSNEMWQRIGLGARDVPAAIAALRERGVDFIESGKAQAQANGGITETWLGAVSFELVHDTRGPAHG